jgi:hypothetical protein
MRYPDGGDLTAQERARREQARLAPGHPGGARDQRPQHAHLAGRADAIRPGCRPRLIYARTRADVTDAPSRWDRTVDARALEMHRDLNHIRRRQMLRPDGNHRMPGMYHRHKMLRW